MTDKRIVYAGAVPVDLDWLEPQRNTELALGYLMQAVMGTTTVIDGLAVTQQGSPNMTVQVGTGSIITYTTVDPTGVAYGAMALNTSNLVKIGINATSVNMSALTAPAVAGQSQNWLIEAKFLEADGSAVVLPYYNASNPSLPYTGPANAGTSQNTRRTKTVQLQWKGGTAATTGTQNTPTPDSGWVGVAIVTVANGQATITNANITPYSSAPTVPTKLPLQRAKLAANLNIYVSATGSDSANSGLSSASAFATLQKAFNYLQSNFDLNGFTATINVGSGTYSTGVICNGPILGQGLGSVQFLGNAGSPSSVVISTSNSNCFYALNGSTIGVSGFRMIATGSVSGGSQGCGISAANSSQIGLTSCEFAACSQAHVYSASSSSIYITGSYTVTGAAAQHYYANTCGQITNATATTCTLTGTPAFTAFAAGGNLGMITSRMTYSGAATGQRYTLNANSVIDTALAGATYFPGSTSGAVANGGYYG